MSKPNRPIWLFVLLILSVGFVVAYGAGAAFLRWWPYRSTFTEYSRSTRMTRETIEYRTGRTGRVIFTHSRVCDSPFSSIVRQYDLMDLHVAEWDTIYRSWQEADGSESGLMAGSPVLSSIISDRFLKNLAEFGELEDAKTWAKRIASNRHMLDRWLRKTDFPEKGFTDRNDFLRWWRGERPITFDPSDHTMAFTQGRVFASVRQCMEWIIAYSDWYYAGQKGPRPE